MGNVREVWKSGTPAQTVQRMQYYPSGLPWADCMGADYQNRKYNGKEFIEMHGYDSYDYHARHMFPALMRFTTIDPLAEKYYSTSPYVYCLNNPIRLIDPTGKFPIETIWDVGNVIYDVGAAVYNHIKGDHKTARSHWGNAAFDAGAMLTPYVPAGTSKVVKAARAGDKVVDAVQAGKAADKLDKVGDAAKAVHGNSKQSTKAQHVYEIFETETGEVVKTGISGGKVSKKGKSYRATRQVNKFNKTEGAGKYDSRIVENIPEGKDARQKALRAEKNNADRNRGTLDPKKHKIP